MVFLIFNSIIASFLSCGGVVIYPFIFIETSLKETPKHVVKHEFLHIEQIKREGFFSFYFNYFFYVFKIYFKTGNFNDGYLKENPYEKECYSRQNEPFTEEDTQILYENGFDYSKYRGFHVLNAY